MWDSGLTPGDRRFHKAVGLLAEAELAQTQALRFPFRGSFPVLLR